MTGSAVKLAATALLASLVLWLTQSGFAAQVPDYSEKEPEVGESAGPARPPVIRTWLDAERRVAVEDLANRWRLSLPGPYWQCQTTEQIAAQAKGQGCAGAGGLPPGLLLILGHKDAPVGGALHVLPERFLVGEK